MSFDPSQIDPATLQMVAAVLIALAINLLKRVQPQLDGPMAFWVSQALNVLTAVAAFYGLELDGSLLGMLGMGVGGGLMSTGFHEGGKRVGLAKKTDR